jgi:hypothetical protein
MGADIGADIEHERAGRNPARGASRDALIKPKIDRKIDALVEFEFPIHIAPPSDHARRVACERARTDDCEIEHASECDFSFGRQHADGNRARSPILPRGQSKSA